jgi:hypothetical protein
LYGIGIRVRPAFLAPPISGIPEAAGSIKHLANNSTNAIKISTSAK